MNTELLYSIRWQCYRVMEKAPRNSIIYTKTQNILEEIEEELERRERKYQTMERRAEFT